MMDGDDRLLGAQREVSDATRAAWRQAHQREQRRRWVWRLVLALAVVFAVIVFRVLA